MANSTSPWSKVYEEPVGHENPEYPNFIMIDYEPPERMSLEERWEFINLMRKLNGKTYT